MFLRMPLSYIRSKDQKQINLFWESGQEGIPPQFVFHVGVNPAVIKACTHLLIKLFLTFQQFKGPPVAECFHIVAYTVKNIMHERVAPVKGSEVFGNDNPIVLEIGCGKGRFITDHA